MRSRDIVILSHGTTVFTTDNRFSVSIFFWLQNVLVPASTKMLVVCWIIKIGRHYYYYPVSDGRMPRYGPWLPSMSHCCSNINKNNYDCSLPNVQYNAPNFWLRLPLSLILRAGQKAAAVIFYSFIELNDIFRSSSIKWGYIKDYRRTLKGFNFNSMWEGMKSYEMTINDYKWQMLFISKRSMVTVILIALDAWR